MRWIGKFTGLIHLLFCIYTLLAYALCYWPVSAHWVSGFVMMSLPIALAGHIVVVVLGTLSGGGRLVFRSLVLVLISFPFWARTFRIGQDKAEKAADRDFRLLSYNVHKLGEGIRLEGEEPLLSEKGIAWLKETDADVICFQEIYQKNDRRLDLVAALKKIGYPHFALVNNEINQKPKSQSGLAVFSRYALKNFRQEIFNGQNGMVKVDVLTGHDTITIVNVHLQSMTLNLRDLVEQRELDGLKSESRKTISRMKNGFEKRNEQITMLEEWITRADHPLVVCGDFNETPYSYPYGRLIRLLNNSFEAGGKGFGFTYRYLPYFIRIDNQFYDDKRMELRGFETVRSANFSDHRPLIGDYYLKRQEEAGEISGFGAHHHLRQSLVYLNVPLMQQPEVYIARSNKLFDESGNFKNADTEKFLQDAVDAYVAWFEKNKPGQ